MSARYAVMRLVALIEEEAARNGYERITNIVITLGAQESISTHQLTSIFDEFRNNSLIKNSRLIIKKRSTLARCRYCGNIFEVLYVKNRCPMCGSTYMEFISDRGISVESVEGE
ncbi:MAG: hydrogenase maturation nickel metallochaperone HypA [Bacillota bacterium]|nr:hydrogenase maturation nickel metallochaperone HypA [Bacillota bacterium]